MIDAAMVDGVALLVGTHRERVHPRVLQRRARDQLARLRRPLLRRVRDGRRRVRVDRRDRGQVLRQLARRARSRRIPAARPERLGTMAGDEGTLRRDLPHCDAGGVGEPVSGPRRVLRARSLLCRGVSPSPSPDARVPTWRWTGFPNPRRHRASIALRRRSSGRPHRPVTTPMRSFANAATPRSTSTICDLGGLWVRVLI